ncbi:nucleotidyl cyclase domain-containing protein [Paraburkholderia phytofirmans]|uniref:hypothetical protein n=1 Tax=Paraburkholderia phytofirmans TaxID=261302 RepID=UPI0038BC587F
MRRAICHRGIEHAGSEHGCLTANIGAVSCTPQSDDDVTATIMEADKALHLVVASGAKRCEAACLSLRSSK